MSEPTEARDQPGGPSSQAYAAEAAAHHDYELTVDLNVLDHLGDGLYSNLAAVMTEAVANTWDADATEVNIIYGTDDISIRDNGRGMVRSEINGKYLTVGYRKRDTEGDKTPGGRPIMGRKGIGKLSLFSIGDEIRVCSKKDGVTAGCVIDVLALRAGIKAHHKTYHPIPMPTHELPELGTHGTMITVTKLKHSRLMGSDEDSLRRRLARRFTVLGSSEFRVTVGSNEVTVADREDMKFVEYIWGFGALPATGFDKKKLKKTWILPGQISFDGQDHLVKGWLGTVDVPRRLSTNEGNLNSIVVMSRGRLVHENIMEAINDGRLFTKYLTGQIETDFLDSTGFEDIVTSNRQRLIENDPRFLALRDFMKPLLNKVEENWRVTRAKVGTDELRERYPAIDKWLERLDTDWRAKAEKLLTNVATMELDEEADRVALAKHAILGFERLRIGGETEELDVALSKGIPSLLKLLADRDSYEASLYRDIVRSRLEVVRKLEGLVQEDKLERILQEFLFDHLWLLDPAWERATDSESMEERLQTKPEFKDDDATKGKFGRVDIRYKTVAGKHVIVELKRASVQTDIHELARQGSKYVEAVRRLLPSEERERAPIEVVFVVGKEPEDRPERIEHALNSVSPGSRLISYESLAVSAKKAYEEFLRASRKADKIEALLSMSAR